MPVTIIGIFTFKEELYKKAVVDGLAPLSQYARDNEPGTTNYSFYTDAEDPLVLMAVEEFVDEAAFATHTESEAFKTFFGIFGPILEAGNVTIVQKTSKADKITVGFGPRAVP